VAVFDPVEVLRDNQHRLWSYLEAGATPTDISAVAEHLFRLPEGDIRRLAAVHLALAPQTETMMSSVPFLLRELPSSVTRSRIETRGRVRPPIDWALTYQRMRQSGDASLFTSHPPERGYDTALARLIVLSLRRVKDLVELGALAGGGLAANLQHLDARATHFLAHAKLRGVTSVRTLPERTLNSLSKFRHAEPLTTFARLYREAVFELTPRVTREVIERRLLAPATRDRLFELSVGFSLIDALASSGFRERRTRLLPASAIPFRILTRGTTQITIWWQRPVWSVLGLDSRKGAYGQVLRSANMSHSSLRPDFTVHAEPGGCVLVVEVKLTEREGETRDRVGIRDALGYLHDLGPALDEVPEPHALVVAWNADGTPGQGKILVCDQDAIGDAVAAALRSWMRAGAQPDPVVPE
jgi:hypothetical protein